MSKLLRLSIVLLFALATALMWSLPASADPPSPTAEECLAVPAPEGCPSTDQLGSAGDTGTSDPVVTNPGTGVSKVAGSAAADPGPTGAQALADAVPALPVPNCDALPGTALPPCNSTVCDSDILTTLPVCVPAPPPTCDRFPELGGLPFCQFPDSDCPAPTTAAAVTDGECTPPITCDQFAQLFGFGDRCSDIPLCIPRDRVPAGFPIPIPSPPLCGPGAGGTTTQPPTTQKPSTQQPVQQAAAPPGVYYANCDDARAHGATNIPRGTAGYRPELDRDNDGYACDEAQSAVAPTVQQPTGKLAYTGVDLEPLLRWAAILVSSGTLLLLAGQRRET